MNDITDSPSKEMHQKVSPSKSKESKDKPIDLDSKIPAIKQAIYNHYGKPDNVVKEKFSYYRDRTTPSGMQMPAWNEGGWQRGRFTVYVGYEKDGLKMTRIPDEGEGSWFFSTNGLSVRIYLSDGIDAVLEL